MQLHLKYISRTSAKSLRALIVLALSLWASFTFALFEGLPFLDGKYPFHIQTNQDARLTRFLTDQLIQHRKQSSEFKLYSNQHYATNFDRDILEKLLLSEGYFAAAISADVTDDVITYTIAAGKQYLLESITLDFPKNIEKPSTYLMPAQIDAPLKAKRVTDSLTYLKQQLLAHECLYELNLSYTAEVDHQTRKGFLTFHLAPSQNVRFGTPQIFGAPGIASALLRKQLTFKKGDCFNRNTIEKSRLKLLQTNLLTKVEPIVARPIAGEVVVSYKTLERSHRTVKAGVGYNTDTDANILLGWQHRNIFGSAQKFDAQASASKVEQSLNSELTLPHYLKDNQTLTLKADISHETPTAYEALQGYFSGIVSRPLKKHFAASIGTALEFSRVKKDGEKDDYSLLSFPVGLDYNKTDNILDPTRGWAFSLKTSPQINLYQTGIRFLEASALTRVYFTRSEWPLKPTLAVRFALGSIFDAPLDEVPADHRFYVGGGGSVRGYKYQSIGNLNNQKPIGGLSFSETSLELRMRFNKHWGAVLFADGGYAFSEKTPKILNNYLWSAGFGIRYFTSFAPIRFDIARPLDIRKDSATQLRIDDPFQIYINIGQSF